MTRYVRISTPSRSASARASAFGRTLKPTTIALEAAASMMSPSVIPPTPWWITETRTSGCWIFASSETAASTEPTTSPLSTRFRSWTAPSWIAAKRFSSVGPAGALRELLAAQTLAARLRELARLPLVLDDAAVLAGGRRMVEAEDLDRVAGPGLLDLLALVVVERAHACPQASPATMASPTCRVPRWTSIVATGPRPTSRRDSMIGPDASAFGFAFSSSSASATSSTRSSRSSRFCFCFAETSRTASCRPTPRAGGPRRRGRS